MYLPHQLRLKSQNAVKPQNYKIVGHIGRILTNVQRGALKVIQEKY